MNKGQIMGGKNSPNKIGEKREYFPNDKLEIWSTSSTIKSQSPKESGMCLSLMNYILTFCH